MIGRFELPITIFRCLPLRRENPPADWVKNQYSPSDRMRGDTESVKSWQWIIVLKEEPRVWLRCRCSGWNPTWASTSFTVQRGCLLPREWGSVSTDPKHLGEKMWQESENQTHTLTHKVLQKNNEQDGNDVSFSYQIEVRGGKDTKVLELSCLCLIPCCTTSYLCDLGQLLWNSVFHICKT